MVSDKDRSTENINKVILNIIVSALIVVRRFFLLTFYPYKTMRKISLESDYYQVGIILFLVFLYFKFVYFLRDKPYPATLIFLVFLSHFFFTIFFFYLCFGLKSKKMKITNLLFTFSYSLLPSLIWFSSTSLLYILVPPPRTFSLMGRAFSIFFITFSLAIVAWKMILVYLALRFSAKQSFYKIIFALILYLAWFIPYSLFLYHLKLFRIPFI